MSAASHTPNSGKPQDLDEAVLKNLQKVNEILGRSAMTLVLLCIVTLGLMYLSETQWRENQALYEKISMLERLRDAPDLQTHIKANWDAIQSAMYHDLDLDALWFKLANEEYQNRAPIHEAVSELKARRRTMWGISGQSVSILGVAVPIGSLAYLVPIIIFVMVHKIANNVYYRHELRNRLAGLEAWREGPELSGFMRSSMTRDASTKYLRATSLLIMAGFLCLPVVTSLLFVTSSYSHRGDYQRASSDFILTVNWGCLLLTLLDVVLIAHREYRPGEQSRGLRRYTRLAWGLPAVVVLLSYLALGYFHAMYLFTAAVMSMILPIGLRMRRAHPERPSLKGFVFTGLILAGFWISIPLMVWVGLLKYSHASPTEIVLASVAIAAGAAVAGAIVARLSQSVPEPSSRHSP